MIKLLFKIEYYLSAVFRYVLRNYLYLKFKEYGSNVKINPNCTIKWPEKVKIGNYVFIEEGAHISCREGIDIGNYVMIGPKITILGGDHKFDDTKTMMWYHTKGIDKKIIIEDDVWIGANVTLLKNAHISKGCVIGACSVVTKKTEPYGVYVGNPAKIVKYRNSMSKD